MAAIFCSSLFSSPLGVKTGPEPSADSIFPKQYCNFHKKFQSLKKIHRSTSFKTEGDGVLPWRFGKGIWQPKPGGNQHLNIAFLISTRESRLLVPFTTVTLNIIELCSDKTLAKGKKILIGDQQKSQVIDISLKNIGLGSFFEDHQFIRARVQSPKEETPLKLNLGSIRGDTEFVSALQVELKQ